MRTSARRSLLELHALPDRTRSPLRWLLVLAVLVLAVGSTPAVASRTQSAHTTRIAHDRAAQQRSHPAALQSSASPELHQRGITKRALEMLDELLAASAVALVLAAWLRRRGHARALASRLGIRAPGRGPPALLIAG